MEATRELLESMYICQEMSLQDIGDELGCSRENIYYHFKKMGIDTRTKEQARQLVYDQGKIIINSFNEKIFDKWTNESAYLLGLLYSDGNISSHISGNKEFNRVSFSQKDPIFMNKVVKLLEFDGNLYTNKRTKVLILSMSSNHMAGKLLELGLYPNKSLTVKFPNIPIKYQPHFIRGMFDGDGSINKTDGVISIISGSKEFINSLYDVLKQNDINIRKYHYKYSTIKISKQSEKLKFANYIYKDKKDMFFDRKYDIFKMFFYMKY